VSRVEFLVEGYVSRATAGAAQPTSSELSRAAEQLTREGRSVRLIRSIFVPADETYYHLFEAQSEDAVRDTASRSGLHFERVVEASSDGTTA
jgi:hypothetical protein